MIKRILCVLFSIIMVSGVSAPVFAALPGEDGILYANITGNQVDFSINNNNLYINISIDAKSGTAYYNGSVKITKITGSITGVVANWTGLTSSTSTFTFYDNSIAADYGTYVMEFSIVAMRYGVMDNFTVTKYATK